MEEKIYEERLQSCFLHLNYEVPLSTIPSSQESVVLRELIGRLGSISNAGEESKETISSSQERGGGRKRKAGGKGKTRSEEESGKRIRSEEAAGDGGGKAAEAPKDYIHVRARRGQATDSHSLAERVRREKISQRMKFLQDLVPGCNKVTGKALMLDEIINYVQSLQRQVEFLSMKLATVNPHADFAVEDVFSRMTQAGFTSFDGCSPAFHFPAAELGGGMNAVAAFVETSPPLPAFWEEDLHSVVQMGLHGGDGSGPSLPATHMTIGL